MRALLALAVVTALGAAEPPTRAEADRAIGEVQAWILAQQRADGAFIEGDTFALGVTALAALALLEEPGLPKDHPAIAGAVRFVVARRQPDGGFYEPNEGLGNYGTSLALRLLVATDGDPALIGGARDWLLGRQNRDAGSLGEGGMGYGDKGPGSEDQSNTGYALQALRAAGVPAEDERMRKAQAFLERCQNLSSVNPAAWVTNDGGGVYGPHDAHGSWERRDAGGAAEKFTSTGTMTYTLISSYLALDLGADDPRVQAALQWVARNWTLDANPGMAPGKERQGLFHYYALIARTFALLGRDALDLPDGRRVDWRGELWARLLAESTTVPLAAGGTGRIWVNSASRWGEGIPHLATAYGLSALKAIRGRLP